MALQTSGPISLNDIHVEAGGTSGTACTINDSDIRALIGKGSGVAMSFSEWYGASSSLWAPTMTAGGIELWGDEYNDNYPYYVAKGYSKFVFIYGSVSDTTVDFLSGATLHSFTKVDQDPDLGTQTNRQLYFNVNGLYSNSGWTSVTISGASGLTGTFTRSSATFYQSSITTWYWPVTTLFNEGVTYTLTFA